MAADTPFRTYVPLPTNPASGNDKSSEYILSEVPIHIITDPSQLPPEILCPSPGKEQVIGFDCERVDLSRYGVLCIMQIASQDAVYIIDAFQGGDKLMQACKPVLESDLVTKVIHDCKRDSEALYFQFGIKLHNVMDTQIAYNLFEEQEGRPRSEIEYISFVDLLADRRYCGISYAENKKVRGLLKEDPMFWTYRPFSEEMVFAAADDVRFLPYIYHKIMEKLNQKSSWQLAVRGALYCRCFCDSKGYADWPAVPAPPDVPALAPSQSTSQPIQDLHRLMQEEHRLMQEEGNLNNIEGQEGDNLSLTVGGVGGFGGFGLMLMKQCGLYLKSKLIISWSRLSTDADEAIWALCEQQFRLYVKSKMKNMVQALENVDGSISRKLVSFLRDLIGCE